MLHLPCFGHTIKTDTALWPDADKGHSSTHDITVLQGDVPENGVNGAAALGPFLQARPGLLWLSVPGIARYLVRDGQSITYHLQGRCANANAILLRGPCLASLMMQRGFLPLRAAAIAFGDSAVLLAGRSGIGKSTLAAALKQRGRSVLSEDLCVVDIDGLTWAGPPIICLWRRALEHLQIEHDTLPRSRPELEKFILPASTTPLRPRPVGAVYVLTERHDAKFGTQRITGMETFVELQSASYHPAYADGMGLRADQLRLCSALAARAPIVKVTRPRHGFALEGLADLIESDARHRGVA